MDYKIGKYDPETRSVPVTFRHAGVTHNRSVNACLKEDGSYDQKATKERVGEVADGVVTKIEIGAIKDAPPAE